MMNQKFKLTVGKVLRYQAPVKNENYIYKFGEGFYWDIEVCVYPEVHLGRSKCVAHYSVDGSKRRYYLIEFYVQDNENLEKEVEKMLDITQDMVDWETAIAEIEKDAEETWEDVE